MALNYSKQKKKKTQKKTPKKKKKKKHKKHKKKKKKNTKNTKKKKKKTQKKKKKNENTTTNADLSAYIRKRLTYGRTCERKHAMTKALLAFRRKSKSLHTRRERAP